MANLDLGARAASDGSWNTTENNQVKWTPIGKQKTGGYYIFTGTFEGNGHTISGVYVFETGDFGGIFGNASNTIQNLTIKDSYIESTGARTGGIVGALRGGNLTNCHNINTEVKGNISIGGIVGQSQGNITKCSNSGIIGGDQAVGGIAGLAVQGTIEKSENTGEIKGNTKMVGGIAGQAGSPLDTQYSINIRKCNNYGNIIGNIEDSCTGGIVGALYNSASIVGECKNTGTITGGESAGKIVGTIYNEATVENNNIEEGSVVITGN